MREMVSLAHSAEISVERSAACRATRVMRSPSWPWVRNASLTEEVSTGMFCIMSCMDLLKSGVFIMGGLLID